MCFSPYFSKVVPTHRSGHPPKKKKTLIHWFFEGIPFIVGEGGIAERVCNMEVYCNFFWNFAWGGRVVKISHVTRINECLIQFRALT